MFRFVFVTVLAAVGFFAGGDAWREFFDLPSLLVTVGGTLAVTYLTFSWVRLPDAAALVSGTFLTGLNLLPQQKNADDGPYRCGCFLTVSEAV